MQLGGHPVYVRPEELDLDVREPVEDVTRILAGYHAGLAARVFEHRCSGAHGRRVGRARHQPLVRSLAPDAGPGRCAHHG